MCTIILIPGTKEQYDSYLSSFSKEFKAEDRDKRCQISDGKGRSIRCPESNKCKDCPFYHSLDKKGYRTLTFSNLSWANEDGLSRREIAKELGVPKSTIIDWVKKIQELTLKFMEDII